MMNNDRQDILSAERLEDRQMLSGSSLNDGTLLIAASATESSTIRLVEDSDGMLSVQRSNDAEVKEFAVEEISKIRFVGRGFNDTVVLTQEAAFETNLTNLTEIEFNGQDGDDVLSVTFNGVAANVIAFGGQGKDSFYLERIGSTGDTDQGFIHGGRGDDLIRGTMGNDHIVGSAGNDNIQGFEGDDLIEGGIGNDRIRGTNGRDTIYGGGGADRIGDIFPINPYRPELIVGQIIYGGAGNDTIYGTSKSDTIFGGAGNDVIHAEEGDDFVSGGDGRDEIYGSHGDDVIFGHGGIDKIFGGNGRDILHGGADSDTIEGNRGADTITGGDGNDGLSGNEGEDLIRGGNGIDRINGGFGNDILRGEADRDLIDGGHGDDFLFGGNGNDRLDGDAGNDSIRGESGNDVIRGSEGNDTLFGGAGIDDLKGEFGDDRLNGGLGDDLLRYPNGDRIIGVEEGSDTLRNAPENSDYYGLTTDEAIALATLYDRRYRITLEDGTLLTNDYVGSSAPIITIRILYGTVFRIGSEKGLAFSEYTGLSVEDAIETAELYGRNYRIAEIGVDPNFGIDTIKDRLSFTVFDGKVIKTSTSIEVVAGYNLTPLFSSVGIPAFLGATLEEAQQIGTVRVVSIDGVPQSQPYVFKGFNLSLENGIVVKAVENNTDNEYSVEDAEKEFRS